MGKRGAMEMGGMHFIGKKGIHNFGERGDNSVEGNHKGLPVQNGQMRFGGKGECHSPVQNGAYALMGKRGAMEMGANAFFWEKGNTQFWGMGRQFCFGQPQGIARTKWGECVFWGNGRMRFARTKWGVGDLPIQIIKNKKKRSGLCLAVYPIVVSS